jgi:hypothetical protein
MDKSAQTEPRLRWQVPVAVLVGAFLFNLGQGVLRPTLRGADRPRLSEPWEGLRARSERT